MHYNSQISINTLSILRTCLYDDYIYTYRLSIFTVLLYYIVHCLMTRICLYLNMHFPFLATIVDMASDFISYSFTHQAITERVDH